MQWWGIEWPAGWERVERISFMTYYKWCARLERVEMGERVVFTVSHIKSAARWHEGAGYYISVAKSARLVSEAYAGTPQEALAFCLFYTGKE